MLNYAYFLPLALMFQPLLKVYTTTPKMDLLPSFQSGRFDYNPSLTFHHYFCLLPLGQAAEDGTPSQTSFIKESPPPPPTETMFCLVLKR